jgi:hypothetical protein
METRMHAAMETQFGTCLILRGNLLKDLLNDRLRDLSEAIVFNNCALT